MTPPDLRLAEQNSKFTPFFVFRQGTDQDIDLRHWGFLVLWISPCRAVCVSRMVRFNLEGGAIIDSPNTGRISLRSPWFVNFELPEDNPDLLVPVEGSAALVLNQLQIALHLDRNRVGSQKSDLLRWNSQRNAKAHLERMAGVKTKSLEYKFVGKRMVEEGVDVGVVDGEEEVKGVLVSHRNLWELWNVVSGNKHIQLAVAATTAPCLHIPVWANAKVHHFYEGPPVRANAHVPPVGPRFTKGAGEEWPVPDHIYESSVFKTSLIT